MRVFVIRLVELFITAIILSVLTTFLFANNIVLSTVKNCVIVFGLVDVVFVTYHVRSLRKCLFEVRDRFVFYVANYMAYLFFMTVTVVAHNVLEPNIYSWFFMITKLFIVVPNIDIPTGLSVVMFHFAMLVIIALAPIGMGWVYEEEFEDEEENPDELMEEEMLNF